LGYKLVNVMSMAIHVPRDDARTLRVLVEPSASAAAAEPASSREDDSSADDSAAADDTSSSDAPAADTNSAPANSAPANTADANTNANANATALIALASGVRSRANSRRMATAAARPTPSATTPERDAATPPPNKAIAGTFFDTGRLPATLIRVQHGVEFMENTTMETLRSWTDNMELYPMRAVGPLPPLFVPRP